MRVLRHPVVQFLGVGFATLAVVLLATGRLSGRAASREAIDDAIATTQVLALSVAQPALPAGLVDGDAGAVDRLDRAVLQRLLVRDVPPRLETVAASVRDSLRSLRSLLVEIHPPDLRTSGLGAALHDLVAPAAGGGIEAEVVVGDLATLRDDTIALVWRVAQEAVRNSLRHARATHLRVDVRRDDSLVVLEVTDDGCGFDPGEAVDRTHFGLRGLDSLIADAGGVLRVTSGPGEGTTVRLEVRP